MTLTTLDDSGAFSTGETNSQLDIPWDDPYPYYASMIPSEPPDDDPVRCTDEENTAESDAAVQQLSEFKPGQFIYSMSEVNE